MIIRVFRALVRKGCVAEFKRLVQSQSIPWLKDAEGMVAYFPGEPIENSKREFVMITLWRDLASVEKFTGKDGSAPVVTEAEAPLVEAMYADHYQRFDGNVEQKP